MNTFYIRFIGAIQAVIEVLAEFFVLILCLIILIRWQKGY